MVAQGHLGRKPTQVKIHLLDKTKVSLSAVTGTRCGIRLQQHGACYYAQCPGIINFTALRLVEENRQVVTCKNCLRGM